MHKKGDIELLWIPSHIDEKIAKGKLTEQMANQIEYIKQRF